MKLKVKHGRIIGIEGQELNPILPNTDLSFIEDKDLFKEIRNYVKSDCRNIENKFIYENGVMKHSNSSLAVAVDMFLKKYHPKYRLARQADLEKDLDFTRSTYNDSGLALRNLTGSNEEQAKHLFEQLKRRGIKEKNFPIWIDLRGLEIDGNLNFNLTDESLYETAKSLNWEFGTGFSEVNGFGLPKEKDRNSSRQIWTNKSNALSRCYLNRDSGLVSNISGLLYSNVDGRVVVAKSRSD